MSIHSRFIIVACMVTFQFCLSIPKPVQLSGKETLKQKRDIYDQNKVIWSSWGALVNYQPAYIAGIIKAPYTSKRTQNFWTKKNIFFWVAMPLSAVGGFLIGYNLTSPTRTTNQLWTGIGLAGAGIVNAFIASHYARQATASYNNDLLRYLDISNEEIQSRPNAILYDPTPSMRIQIASFRF